MNEVAMNLAVAPAWKTFVWTFAITVLLPILITGGAVFFANKSMLPGIVGSVSALSVVVFAAFVYFLLRNEIFLDDKALTVKAAFYERSVNLAEIKWADSRIIDHAREPELMPATRVNGIGLPGYQAGWFRLQNGTRAFLLRTHGPLAYLPDRSGGVFLLSVTKKSPLFEKIQAEDFGK